ncbi:MAG: tetratricopeptide repeat protein [Bryobacteraceae bacterium]
MSHRLESLKSLVAQDPANSRFRYMMAMEVANMGDLEGSVPIFEELLQRDPDYSAGYFHGGQTLEKLGRVDEAREIYRRGIEATRRNGDAHTRSELQGALDMLGG